MAKIYQKYSIEELIKYQRTSAIFYKWLRRELVYTSNAIELNKLTRKETEEILDLGGKKLKNKYKDSIETINLAKTLDASLRGIKSGVKIDENFIMDMHTGIMKDSGNPDFGFYRNYNVRPQGCCHSYVNYPKIPKRMEEIIDFINNSGLPTFEMAIETHYKFVKVHPFGDGNGRTARLLMNILLMNDGIIPVFVRPETRKEYIDVLANRQMGGSAEPYSQFMNKSFYASALTVCDFLDKNRFR